MDNYEPLELLGSGSFGVIRKVRRISDGKVLARKEIDYRRMSEKEKRQLVAEVNILRELRHPNIVRYYERVVNRHNCQIYIIMEYCEGGDLAAVIRRCKKEKRYIPEDVVWNLLSQLLLALQECHRSDVHPAILHRDIKPDNVFLDKMLNVKLGDFGLSRIIDNPEVEFAKTYVGTPFYMSPELVNESRYNTKSDVWALGCIIYELCTLEPPFQANSQPALATKIRAGKIQPLPSQYSSELEQMIQAMLILDYEKRPSTQELLGHQRIRLSIREQDLANGLADLKKKEEELARRLACLEEREQAVSERERELENLSRLLQDQHLAKLDKITRHGSLPPTPPAKTLGLSGLSKATHLPLSTVQQQAGSPLGHGTNRRCVSGTAPTPGTKLPEPLPAVVSPSNVQAWEHEDRQPPSTRQQRHTTTTHTSQQHGSESPADGDRGKPVSQIANLGLSPQSSAARLRGRIGAFRARSAQTPPSLSPPLPSASSHVLSDTPQHRTQRIDSLSSNHQLVR